MKNEEKEILNSVLLIDAGDEIINIHTGTEFTVVNIDESTIIIMNEDGKKSLIYWNALLENFKIKNEVK